MHLAHNGFRLKVQVTKITLKLVIKICTNLPRLTRKLPIFFYEAITIRKK